MSKSIERWKGTIDNVNFMESVVRFQQLTLDTEPLLLEPNIDEPLSVELQCEDFAGNFILPHFCALTCNEVMKM